MGYWESIPSSSGLSTFLPLQQEGNWVDSVSFFKGEVRVRSYNTYSAYILPPINKSVHGSASIVAFIEYMLSAEILQSQPARDSIVAGNSSIRLSMMNAKHVLENNGQLSIAIHSGRNKMQKQLSLLSQTSLKNFTYKKRIERYTLGIFENMRFQSPQLCMASIDNEERKSPKAVQVSKSSANSIKYFDFSIIGSGVAGLRYAIEVAKHGSVAVITKAEPHESNTNYAQGGVSAVFSPSDSVENHIQDTIVAGAYLCDEETVKVVCTEGPDRVRELMTMGASFDHGEDGSLHLAREGGHSHHRIVHAADMTGREIERALLKAVVNNPNITMFEHHLAIDLLTTEDVSNIYCHGVDTLNTNTNEVVRFISRVTLLASGGAGHIYPTTTNPRVATGDGIAMAHRASAVISNMEFVQFHPTALADEGLPIKPHTRENSFLISEAVRGAGGILYNQAMERFMPQYDSRGELAPRDVVARSIDDQLKKRNERYVLLDISHRTKEEILYHFPNIAAECLKYGLDITESPIPVVPAAHYMCGGVQAKLHGETPIMGLYVAGEVACTGLHGANRLASNSLLEALVFAQRAVEPSLDYMIRSNIDFDESVKWPFPVVPTVLGVSQLNEVKHITALTRMKLQKIMWDYVGIVRSIDCLKIAEKSLADLELEWEDHLFRFRWRPYMVNLEVCELRNLFSCANLVVSSALARQESRGLHYIVDFPNLVESQRLPTIIFPSKPLKSTWSTQLVHRLFADPVCLCDNPNENKGGTLVGQA